MGAEKAVATILRILAEGDIELTISSEIGSFIGAVTLLSISDRIP